MLTMGELCVDHERELDAAAPVRRWLQRVITATAVVAVAAAGAAIRLRVR